MAAGVPGGNKSLILVLHWLLAKRILMHQLVMLSERLTRPTRAKGDGALANLTTSDWQLRHRDGKTLCR